jgi:predicted nicotinamide N-methyase
LTARLYRPEPVLKHAATPIDRSTPIDGAALRLAQREQLIVRDHYRTGVLVLAELERQLGLPGPGAPFAERQAASVRYREAALRLLAPITGHRLALEEGGPSGFLGELYAELRSFALPFIEVQSLHGAWERYDTGTHLAVLGHSLHPFYGTYAPTRVSHLELFGTWLSQYEGPRVRAVDVGTGSGVLALMLARAGFGHIVATDSNPNAIESVSRELQRRPTRPPIELIHGDLLGPGSSEEELVVFNPPWIQGTVASQLDSALYFEPSLFERFFDQAVARLSPQGRIALVFSNVMTLLQPDIPHPIEAELARARLQLVSKRTRKVKPTPDKSGRRRRTKERVEVWELARA